MFQMSWKLIYFIHLFFQLSSGRGYTLMELLKGSGEFCKAQYHIK